MLREVVRWGVLPGVGSAGSASLKSGFGGPSPGTSGSFSGTTPPGGVPLPDYGATPLGRALAFAAGASKEHSERVRALKRAGSGAPPPAAIGGDKRPRGPTPAPTAAPLLQSLCVGGACVDGVSSVSCCAVVELDAGVDEDNISRVVAVGMSVLSVAATIAFLALPMYSMVSVRASSLLSSATAWPRKLYAVPLQPVKASCSGVAPPGSVRLNRIPPFTSSIFPDSATVQHLDSRRLAIFWAVDGCH